MSEITPNSYGLFDTSVRSPEKEHIARTAVNLIRERDTIFLGPGSTCALIARALPRMRLRVITNSIIVLNMLQTRNDVEIWALGGQYRKRSGSFVGPIAEDALAPLGIDTWRTRPIHLLF